MLPLFAATSDVIATGDALLLVISMLPADVLFAATVCAEILKLASVPIPAAAGNSTEISVSSVPGLFSVPADLSATVSLPVIVLFRVSDPLLVLISIVCAAPVVCTAPTVSAAGEVMNTFPAIGVPTLPSVNTPLPPTLTPSALPALTPIFRGVTSVNPPAPLVTISPVPVSVILLAAVIEMVLPVSVTLLIANAPLDVSVRLSLLVPPLLEEIVIPLALTFTVCAVPASVVIFPPSASAPLEPMKIFPFAFAPSLVTFSVPPTVTSSGVTSVPIAPVVACSVRLLAPLVARVAPPTNDPSTTVTGSRNVTFDETVTTPVPLL